MYKSVEEWNDYLTKNLGISYADFMDMFSENMDIAPKDLIRQIKEKLKLRMRVKKQLFNVTNMAMTMKTSMMMTTLS